MAIAVAIGGGQACTEFADPSERLEPDSNSDGGQGAELEQGAGVLEADAAWSCLPTATGEDRVSNGRGEGLVTLRISFHDQISQQPLTNLEVRACSGTDIACVEPVVDWAPVSQDGRWAALVPWGFFGYVETRADDRIPTLSMIDTPVRRDLELYSHAVLQPPLVDSILQVLGITWDRESGGIVGASALDCVGRPAGGVRIDLGGAGQAWVLDNGVPVLDRDISGPDGVVGFVNVPAGVRSARAVAPDGSEFDSAGFIVRPGWYSGSFLRPVVYSIDELCTDIGARPGVYGVRDIEVCDSAQPPD